MTDSERTYLRDAFGHERLKEKKIHGRADARRNPQIEANYRKWLNDSEGQPAAAACPSLS